MKEQFVYDPLISKRQQYLLATQVRQTSLLVYVQSRQIVDLDWSVTYLACSSCVLYSK